MKKLFLLPMLALMGSCADNSVKVEVTNNSDTDRTQQTVELNAADILGRLGASFAYVTDANGNEIPSQTTYDGKIIFQVDFTAGQSAEYIIAASDTLRSYPTIATGRIFPERADDLSWENENGGYRAYGPSTQNKGERAFGYDIFLKHYNQEPVLETLYSQQCSSDNWHKVDSLRAISGELAQAFINSFTYHLDHGLGMDCYAVGPTLGDGVAALVNDDESIAYPWCYTEADILDNGPLRFTVAFTFGARNIGNDSTIVEKRLISLDAGSYLNHAKVWYEGLNTDRRIVAGFPLRDESAPIADNDILAYADPTQGPDNGHAMLGIVIPSQFDSTYVAENHILGSKAFAATDTLEYFWGQAWNREQITDMDAWQTYLRNFAAQQKSPLNIVIK